MPKLEDYRLLHEDEKSYHLEHPDGSKMKISKRSLSPQVKKTIAAHFSEKQTLHAAKGGILLNPKDSEDQEEGDTAEGAQQLDGPNPAPEDYTPLAPPVSAQETLQTTPPTTAPLLQPSSLPTIDSDALNPDPQAVATQTQDALLQGSNPSNMSQPLQGPSLTGINQMISGVKAEEKAKQLRANQEAKAYTDLETSINNAHEQSLQRQKVWAENDQKLHDDYLNSKLDENRYLNSMSTGQRIATTFSLIFGGLASGWTGRNVGLEILNDAIHRDIDAQKTNLAKKQSLYRDNHERYKDASIAEDRTVSQLLTLSNAKLHKIAAATSDPLIHAQALQTSGQLIAQRDQINNTILGQARERDLSRAFYDATPEALSKVNLADFPKDLRQGYVESVGFVPPKVAPELTKFVANKTSFISNAKDVLNYFSNGRLNYQKYQNAETMMSMLQDKYRQMNNEGVFKAGESEFVKGVLGNLAIYPWNATPGKIQTVIHEVDRDAENLFYQQSPNYRKAHPRAPAPRFKEKQ